MNKILFIYFLTTVLFSFKFKPSNDFFQIIHVNGVVLAQKTQTPLKTGMKIENHEQLLFKTTDASLIVSNNARGRFIIKSPSQKNANGELVAFAKDVVLPFKGNTTLSTRGKTSEVSDFKSYLGDNNFYIIGNKLEFEVTPSKYKIEPLQFFQIRFQLNDSTKVAKVPNVGNRLIFDSQKLFKNTSGKITIPEKIELFWIIARPRTVERVAIFRPVFLDENELKAEYKVLFDLIANQKLSDEEYNNHIYGYFRDVYGKTDETILGNWLEENFKR